MKKCFAAASLLLLLLPVRARAERTLRQISWPALKADGSLLGGEVVTSGGASASLRVTNPGPGPRVVPLFSIAPPGVTAPRYALRGTVAGEGVEGSAYLEMWNHFPGGGMYFSRTLAAAGPMASLRGTFAPRPFVLPFTTEGPGQVPAKLDVNVAFPGKGTVVLDALRLVQLDPGDEFFGADGAWLTPRQIGLVGGIGGGVLGLLGAAVGVLASQARARAVVVGALYAMLGVGLAALGAAAFAWRAGQPSALQALLVLVGVVGTAVPAGVLGRVRRAYEELEFRRMKALDVG
jgi:hypothetical protein